MNLQQHLTIIENMKSAVNKRPTYQQMQAFFAEAQYLLEEFPEERERAFAISNYVKSWYPSWYAETGDEKYKSIFEKCLLFEAPYIFDSYIRYLEKNRPYKKRFYEPREDTLRIVVQDLQDLEDGLLDFYGLSMPSRVGKSTICIFFLSWIMGKRPNSHNAMGGHSGILAKGFYKELLNLVDTPEYTFSEIFPSIASDKGKVVQNQSADEFTINLGSPDRFSTMTCRGIDGTWTGAVDVSPDGYLYVDDLVRDREHSLSPNRMENTFQEYLNKMVDRKNDGSRELMVGTLWNILDPLEKMRKKYENNPKYRFRKIPALNEKNESNFNFKVNGFSTKYYINMKDRLDNAEWMAKFQQHPYVREGLLYPENELEFYNGILPDGDCRTVAVVDVAWGGGDSLSMPIGKEYADGTVYITDWVFNRGAKEITIPLVTGKIIQNEIRQTRFEGNTGGDLYCKYVEDKLIEQGWSCSCTHKKAPNKMKKMSKIIAFSGDVKRKFRFLSPNLEIKRAAADEKDKENGIDRLYRSEEYSKAMDELGVFVTIGNNDHDDAADGLTQLVMFVNGDRKPKVSRIIPSPI